MAKAKRDFDSEIKENKEVIRLELQKLMIKILKEANNHKELEKSWPRLLGAMDKGTKFLALENNIDEGGWGEDLRKPIDDE